MREGAPLSRSRACCSVPGCCCSSFAPRVGRNTCSAPCRLPSRRHTRKHMTTQHHAPRRTRRRLSDRDTTSSTSKGHFASNKIARRHSGIASTRTISPQGSPILTRIRTAPQRERFDTHDLRRGSIRECQNRKKPRVFAPRPRRSPQRVARAPPKKNKKTQKTSSFLHLDHADLRRGSHGHIKKRVKTLSFCTSTTPIPAEGRIPDRRQHPHPPPRRRFLIPSSFSFFPAL